MDDCIINIIITKDTNSRADCLRNVFTNAEMIKQNSFSVIIVIRLSYILFLLIRHGISRCEASWRRERKIKQ